MKLVFLVSFRVFIARDNERTDVANTKYKLYENVDQRGVHSSAFFGRVWSGCIIARIVHNVVQWKILHHRNINETHININAGQSLSEFRAACVTQDVTSSTYASMIFHYKLYSSLVLL